VVCDSKATRLPATVFPRRFFCAVGLLDDGAFRERENLDQPDVLPEGFQASIAVNY